MRDTSVNFAQPHLSRSLPHKRERATGLSPVALDRFGRDRHGPASCPWHPSKYYSADAPGRPGSARIITTDPGDSTRGVEHVMVKRSIRSRAEAVKRAGGRGELRPRARPRAPRPP